jgi:hypothetical protein
MLVTSTNKLEDFTVENWKYLIESHKKVKGEQ